MILATFSSCFLLLLLVVLLELVLQAPTTYPSPHRNTMLLKDGTTSKNMLPEAWRPFWILFRAKRLQLPGLLLLLLLFLLFCCWCCCWSWRCRPRCCCCCWLPKPSLPWRAPPCRRPGSADFIFVMFRLSMSQRCARWERLVESMVVQCSQTPSNSRDLLTQLPEVSKLRIYIWRSVEWRRNLCVRSWFLWNWFHDGSIMKAVLVHSNQLKHWSGCNFFNQTVANGLPMMNEPSAGFATLTSWLGAIRCCCLCARWTMNDHHPCKMPIGCVNWMYE